MPPRGKRPKKGTKAENRNLQSELAVGFNRLVTSLDKIEQGQRDIVKQLKEGDKKQPGGDKPPKKQPPPKPIKLDWSGFRDVKKGWTQVSRAIQTKTFRTIGKGFNSLTSSLKSVFSAVAGEMGEMGSFLSQTFSFTISGMLGSMFNLAKQFGQYKKMIVGTFGVLKGVSIDLARTSVETGLSMGELAGGFNKLTTEFGKGMSEVSSSQMKSMAITSKNIGIQSSDLAHIAGMYGLIGDMTLQQSLILAENTALLAQQNDVAPDQVMKDIAESGEEFAKFSKGGVKNFIATAIQARRLGVSLKTIAGSLRGMLNLEDSITKEMQASVMLGQRLNFMDARRLALAGDTSGAFRAIRRELGGIDLAGLDPLTMEAVAEAANMSATDLLKLAKGEPLDKVKDPMVSTAEATTQIAETMKTAMGWLTPMEKIMARLSKEFKDSAEMGMADTLIDLTKKLFPVALKLTHAFGRILSGLTPTIEKLVTMFTDWLTDDKIKSFTGWIGNLIDSITSGDFSGFWDNFLAGLRPAVDKAFEFLKPLLDKLFGDLPIIGDWFKSLDGKVLVKHLDKIILGFIGFKLGLIGIFAGISKMLWGLVKGPFKAFKKSTFGNLGMGGEMGRGLFGTRNIAGGAREGGFLGKGGKYFKGFKGMGGKMLGAAGLAISALDLGKDIWDSFSKTGIRRKKALGGALGGAIGGGIGFFLGGPVGAALGAQFGRFIGQTVGTAMANESDKTMAHLENNLQKAQQKLEEVQRTESVLEEELQLAIQGIGHEFSRAAGSLFDSLTPDTKIDDLTTDQTSILTKIFDEDTLSNQTKFTNAITKFLEQGPDAKFKALMEGADSAATALVKTAMASTAYQEAETNMKLAKMKEETLKGESKFLSDSIGLAKKKGLGTDLISDHLLGTLLTPMPVGIGGGAPTMKSPADKKKLGQFMRGDTSWGAWSSTLGGAVDDNQIMNVIQSGLRNSFGPSFGAQIEQFMGERKIGDFKDLGAFSQVLDMFAVWAQETNTSRLVQHSEDRIKNLNRMIDIMEGKTPMPDSVGDLNFPNLPINNNNTTFGNNAGFVDPNQIITTLQNIDETLKMINRDGLGVHKN